MSLALRDTWRNVRRRLGWTSAPVLGLTLSGGGSRGIAHIGVIAALEEFGLQPQIVTGTSAGSLAGALYSAGWSSTRMMKAVHSISWRARELIDWTDWRGVMDSDQIEALIRHHLGDLLIEDLERTYAAVAVDLLRGEEVVFDSGPVAHAVRASCAVPGVFTPVEDDGGRLLVDGGLLNNIPVGLAREMGATVVIAVDVSTLIETPSLPRNLFDMLELTFYTLRRRANKPGGEPDCLIMPAIHKYGAIRFRLGLREADTLYQAGYRAAHAALPAFVQAFEMGHVPAGKHMQATGTAG